MPNNFTIHAGVYAMQQNRKCEQKDDSQDDSPQVVLQTKTRRQVSKPTLKRGLSTVEEEEEAETVDHLVAKESARTTKKTKAKAVKETKFEATVQTDKAELRDYLQSHITNVGEVNTQFNNRMKTYLTSLGIPVSKTKDSRSQEELHSMLTTAWHLIEASRQVDKEFRAMIATAESVQKELKKEESKNTWQEDKKEAVQLLEKGMRLSMKRIDQLMPDTAKAGKHASSIDISSDLSYTEASVYFTATHPQEKRLKEALVQTMKGVKRIVRFLPEQQEEDL